MGGDVLGRWGRGRMGEEMGRRGPVNRGIYQEGSEWKNLLGSRTEGRKIKGRLMRSRDRSPGL